MSDLKVFRAREMGFYLENIPIDVLYSYNRLYTGIQVDEPYS
jgi:hypothetical protein